MKWINFANTQINGLIKNSLNFQKEKPFAVDKTIVYQWVMNSCSYDNQN